MNRKDPSSEADWILALKDGTIWAYNELFHRYGKRLYGFSIGYLKSAQDAEEIVQEVFLKIWKNREELSDQKSFDAYLFTIAKNGVLNTIRKAQSEKVYLNYLQIHPEKNILLDEELNFKELERAYNKVIELLSPRRKEIFIMSKKLALSNADIAEKMNISIKTVENQMTSAISEIRRNLRSLGFSGIIFLELFH